MASMQNKKHKDLKIIEKALKYTDPCITFFYLKKIHTKTTIPLSDKIAEKLFNFIRSFNSSGFPFNGEFENHMAHFLKHVSITTAKMHIKCLSLLPHADLDHYREAFSFGKIYHIFKDEMKTLFVDGTSSEFLEYLVVLLDNNKLVYKETNPVIQKIGLLFENRIIDKSIVECSIVLNSIVKHCAELMNSSFISSIFVYLADILLDPQNYVFLPFKESKQIVNTIQTMADFLSNCKQKTEIGLKKTSFGLLRLLTEKIVEFKTSTVYEETMVVLSATDCLESVFKLFLAAKNENTGLVKPSLLKFTLFDRKQKLNDTENKKEEKLNVDFERPFKHHYNAQYQLLRDDFIVSKYRFLDLLSTPATFERIEFLNDLTKVEDTHKLFPVLNNIKKCLEWSDLIVFACNAPNKEAYIPLIFDPFFTSKPEHHVFLDIFISNVISSDTCLVYSTHYAVKILMMRLLAKLYVIKLDQDDNYSKKRREMIIRLIAGLGENDKNDEELNMQETEPVIKKEVTVNTETRPLENDFVERIKTIEIKEIISEAKFNELENAHFVLLASIVTSPEVEEFVNALTIELEYIHKNLVPLLIALVNKKLSEELLMRFLEVLREKLNGSVEDVSGEPSVICLFAIYCSINHFYFFNKHKIETKKDLFIGTLCLKTGKYDEDYIKKIKQESYDVLMNIKLEDVNTAKEIYNFEPEKSIYIEDFYKIADLLNGN